MKNLSLFALLFMTMFLLNAQENIDELLAAGVKDAKTFTTYYIAPSSEGLAFGINNGWFNKATTSKRFKLEFSILANGSFIKDEKKSFTMNVSDYENIRFSDNSPSKTVATSLGHNDPDVSVFVTYNDPIFGEQEVEVTLPTGIGATNISLIPTAYLQASFSPFKGTEIKGRFFPKVNIEDANIGLYGVGIQQEFTRWLPAEKVFPVAVSGVVAYTRLNGSYDFTDTGIVDGENQQIETIVNTMLYQLVVGTKLKMINFYGGLGYVSGKSTTNLLGTYRVSNGVVFADEIVDPFSIKQDVKGVRTSLGANLKLGFFALNADYTFAEFDSASLGINFSF
ncbi:DUF6588 family protein [Pontimicrobium aquaticum]|uniref:MetA-pathway of phenol degradation n=1 Tax=Pontimicrobium aquaticum TaxID=2565367 RepID=A0A4U0F0J5_9FLAO|nr:DUF6588 family protein [Pontimicrobium aquaticum]TJY37244.1 hypothetical protein E5167_04655 [Pontimicrobium aquaticum]